MNDDEDQKFRNLVLFNMYVTDKERDEIMPWMGVLLVVILVIAGIVWLFTK